MLKSPNPTQMLKSMIGNDQQKLGVLNQLQTMTKEEQAQKIADLCNEKGISLDQLKKILGK